MSGASGSRSSGIIGRPVAQKQAHFTSTRRRGKEGTRGLEKEPTPRVPREVDQRTGAFPHPFRGREESCDHIQAMWGQQGPTRQLILPHSHLDELIHRRASAASHRPGARPRSPPGRAPRPAPAPREEGGKLSRTTAPPPGCRVQVQVPGGVARSIPAHGRASRAQ
eukprot:scaffold2892_cov112-Isochrysis_galbana.AAC.2